MVTSTSLISDNGQTTAASRHSPVVSRSTPLNAEVGSRGGKGVRHGTSSAMASSSSSSLQSHTVSQNPSATSENRASAVEGATVGSRFGSMVAVAATATPTAIAGVSGTPTTASSSRQQSLPPYGHAIAGIGLSSSSDAISSSASASPRHLPAAPGQRGLNASLPDILHSHLGPQLRQNQHRHNRGERQQQQHRSSRSHGEGGGDTGNVSSRSAQHHGSRSHRSRGERNTRRSRTVSTSSAQGQEGGGPCKEPCVKCVVTITSFRWVLVLLSVLGVCCVVAGIILAALHAVGNSFLFLAIMFISE